MHFNVVTVLEKLGDWTTLLAFFEDGNRFIMADLGNLDLRIEPELEAGVIKAHLDADPDNALVGQSPTLLFRLNGCVEAGGQCQADQLLRVGAGVS